MTNIITPHLSGYDILTNYYTSVPLMMPDYSTSYGGNWKCKL